MRKLSILVLLVLTSCAERSSQPSTSPSGLAAPPAIDLKHGNLQPSSMTAEEAVNPGPDDSLFVGAGDIARGEDLPGAKATGDLIRARLARFDAAKVFTAGDNAYLWGSTANFRDYYDPTWGSFKGRTSPTPGNHEYLSGMRVANDYFDYFNGSGVKTGPAGERGKGYYSFNLKKWHIVALNSELFGKDLESQRQWLEKDLASSEGDCTLAYWHRPLFTSGEHGEPGDHLRGDHTKVFWQVLESHGADVVVNGHDHEYERFAPLDSNGSPSSSGIREFVVGTGGGEKRNLWSIQPHSEAQLANQFGILALTLHPNSYSWAFLGTDGRVYDPGENVGTCHPKHGQGAGTP